MDGIHDLGGKQGFGKIIRDAQEPAFHERWEASVYAAMTAIAARGWLGNIDRFRHAIERIDPAAYLTHTYYGRWLGGLETLLEEEGHLRSEDLDRLVRQIGGLDERQALLRAARPSLSFEPESPAESGGLGAQRKPGTAPRFSPRDRVRTNAYGHGGHTRLPAYVRDKTGEVVASHGAWVYPDSNAHGRGEQPCHLYTIAFEGKELWGSGSEPGMEVCIDLFEPYLESCGG